MAEIKRGPLFRNKTRIDQLFYDDTFSPVVVPPGKTIRGNWCMPYAGRNGALVLVKEPGEKNNKDEAKKNGTGKSEANREGKA